MGPSVKYVLGLGVLEWFYMLNKKIRFQNRGLIFYYPPRPPPPGLVKDQTFYGFFSRHPSLIYVYALEYRFVHLFQHKASLVHGFPLQFFNVKTDIKNHDNFLSINIQHSRFNIFCKTALFINIALLINQDNDIKSRDFNSRSLNIHIKSSACETLMNMYQEIWPLEYSHTVCFHFW